MLHIVASLSPRLARSPPSIFFHFNHVRRQCSRLVRSHKQAKVPSRQPSLTYTSTLHRRTFVSGANSWPPQVKPPTAAVKPKIRTSSDGYTRFTRQAATRTWSPLMRYAFYFGVGGVGVYIYSIVDYAPFTGRVRLLGISRVAEMDLGRRAFEDLLHSFGAECLLPTAHPETQRVRRVVTKLARTSNAVDRKLAEGFQWAVVVADVAEPNAMCVPGGRILVTTGLLEILHSDDDIAIIIGHEIAHALNRHGVESMSLQRLLWPFVMLVNQVLDMRMLPSLFVTLFLSLPYSRNLEYEADTVGLLLCTEACYDPRVAPGVFRRLAELQGEHERAATTSTAARKLGSFFSTHPQTDERARRLEGQLSECMRVYNDKCVHRHAFSGSMSRDFGRF